MGQRLRLKRGYDISRFPRQARIVLTGAQALRDDPRRQRLVLVRERRARPALEQRPAPHARPRARQRVRGRRVARTLARVERPGRLLGLAVQGLARPAVPGGPSARRAGWPLRARSSTRSRSTRPSTGWPRATPSPAGSSRRPTASCSPPRPAATSPTRGACGRSRRASIASTSAIMPLVEADKLGPVVWQFPRQLQARRRSGSRRRSSWSRRGRHCFEFRHESWFAERGLRAPARARRRPRDRRPPALALPSPRADGRLDARPPPPRPPRAGAATTPRPSSTSGPGGSREWRRRAELFVYFNNDWEGFAVENAARSSGGCSRLQTVEGPPQQP